MIPAACHIPRTLLGALTYQLPGLSGGDYVRPWRNW